MNVLLAIVGSLLGVAVELITPWSQIIMGNVQNVLAIESTHNYPGLPSLIQFLGIFAAYLMLPLGFGGLGFAIGSSK
jgi:hypothetical protein